jgi:DNA polymerase-3 subunit epsilon
VGIVCVEDGQITQEFVSLIKPPGNQYAYHNINVHGIRPEDTLDAPTFADLFPQIESLLKGRVIVAHNESFDRNVLSKTMTLNGLDYLSLDVAPKWECTLKIYRAKGLSPAKLSDCCRAMGIALHHHEALSDARAAALLYLQQEEACFD